MKKNFIYALVGCLVLSLASCSTDPEDATSKHVYGENENPYLKTNLEATVSTSMEFPISRLAPKTIKLTDYVEKFHTQLGMTVDETLSALSNGNIVFYPINTTMNVWNRQPSTKGSNGWYWNAAGGICEAKDGVASVELDAANKSLIVNVEESAVVGTAISMNVGFAIDNGENFDDYVRFTMNITVTDPGKVVVAQTIPTGDYAAMSISFADYEKEITEAMGMSLKEFITACKSPDGPVALYMVDKKTGEWDTVSDYTAGGSGIGYWLTSDFKVTGWSGDGSTGSELFVETAEGGDMVSIGRHPVAASGTVYEFSFVYAMKEDFNRFVTFIVKATLE